MFFEDRATSNLSKYQVHQKNNGGQLIIDFLGKLATIIDAIAFLGVLSDLAKNVGKYLGAAAGIFGFVFGLIGLIDRCINANGLVMAVIMYSAIQILLVMMAALLAVTLIGLLVMVLVSVAINALINIVIDSNPECREA